MKPSLVLIVLAISLSNSLLAQVPNFQFVIPIQGAGGGGSGNANYDQTRGIGTDAAGNIYAAGFFTGEADFDPSTGQALRNTLSGQDPFLVKYSPSGTYQWVAHIKGGQNDWGNGLVVDSAGNSYIVGWFSFVIDFDPSPATFNLTTVGNNDIFLAKYDPQGNLVWAHNFGGTLSDMGNAIAFTANGDIAITGHFQGTADFDPSPATVNLSSAGNKDIFLATYSPDGAFLSAISLGGTGEDDGMALATDSSGAIFLTGFFSNSADFDPGSGNQTLTSSGLTDLFLARYTSGTTLDWVGGAGSAETEKGLGLAVAANGDVVLTGAFSNTVDLDLGSGSASHTSAGLTDAFLARYTNAGSHIWSHRFGSTFDDAGQALSLTSTGDIGMTGYFRGTVDFDPGAGSATEISDQRDLFAGTYTPSGDFEWVFHVGGTVDDEGLCLDFDYEDNLILGGYYWSNTDFDPSPANAFIAGTFLHEGFVAKYGNPCITATSPQLSPDLVLCEGDSAILTVTGGDLQGASGWNWYQGSCGGTFVQTGSVLQTGSLVPGTHTWFVRGEGGCAGDGPCDTVHVVVLANAVGSQVASICQGDSYTFGSQTLISAGVYNETFTAVNGCDSVVTLILSVIPTQTSSLSASICQGDSYAFGSQTLTTSGTFSETFSAANGCDSVVTLILSVIPAQTSSQNASICEGESYTFGSQTLTTAGTYSETFPAASGCDSVVTLTLSVVSTLTSSQNASICQGDSYMFGSQTLTTAGTYSETFPAASGCDSVVTLTLAIQTTAAQVIVSSDRLAAGVTGSYQWLDCNLGFSPIEGATDSLFQPMVSGSYALLLGQNGCSDTSDCVSFTTAITPESNGIVFRLSPNPAHQTVEVSAEFTTPRPTTLRIHDLLGRLWHSASFSAASHWDTRIDLSNLPAGVYNLTISDAKGRMTKRLVKE